MAKWGEGDPRWIVEERPDATNVNNWHWSEKNASQWSKDKLKELFEGLIVDDPTIGRIEVTELNSITGEAIANNRKAKLIFFYEWVVKGKWRGHANGTDEEIKGSFEIPNLSEENDADEIEVEVSVKDSHKDKKTASLLKEMMRNKGTEMIRRQISIYIQELKNDFAKDLIKPTSTSTSVPHSNSISCNLTKETSKLTVTSKEANPKQISSQFITNGSMGVKIETKTLKLKEKMKCRADEIFRVFTVQGMVAAFSRGACKVDPTTNGKFSMFDGNVNGSFVTIDQDRKLHLKWRFKSWPDEHYSDVRLLFEEKDDHTLVELEQDGIPANDFERTENGWRERYFHAIKQTFGFGSMLF